jgi:predicted nucleic acid-binding protein
MPAVSNTSPISNLAYIGRLDLLREQFRVLWIPLAVRAELAAIPDASVRQTVENAIQAGWIAIQPSNYSALLQLLTASLHLGEAEAIALAFEMKADRVLIDERDGRMIARQLSLPVTGVLGVLLRAKELRRITAVKPEIEALRRQARFFIDSDLEKEVLKNVGKSTE